MPIYRAQPAAASESLPLDEMPPRQIVEELNKYVVGQEKAKRAVAVALRNRIRRQKLSPEMAREIQPKNIILIGPTGVGKTEIARRLARLANSPWIKVEASKFTEVGYVGRDAESIIRDLVDAAFDMIRSQKVAQIEAKAEENAEERLLDLLVKKRNGRGKSRVGSRRPSPREVRQRRERLRRQLREGKLAGKTVEVEVPERLFPAPEWIPAGAFDEMDWQFRDLLSGLLGNRTYKRKMPVEEAIDYFISEEESKLIDFEQVARESIQRVEEAGIVFLDEIDKIAGRESGHGPEVSREGVQRDILPIIEGTTVNTRYGMVRTDHILFIAAGAFHVSKPSDLIPELQGRFPIRVEMEPLTEQDLVRILKEPRSSLIRQCTELLATEGITLTFTDGALREIARFATLLNETTENIGARRLSTILEALLEEISFRGPETPGKKIRINARYVRSQLSEIIRDQDLSRYIL